MTSKTVEKQLFAWADPSADRGYDAWRSAKLSRAEICRELSPVALGDLANPTESERKEIASRCRNDNFAVYSAANDKNDSAATRHQLRAFADHFGLRIAEAHRSEGEAGIVALTVSDAPSQRGYIPYSTRGMNWHTDGYYNAPGNLISAFVLHCVEQAAQGGANDILDPEILYIRLRDAHPAYLAALMHPQAMTIPENREANGGLRPASVGPVFYPDADSGRLQMRYTARTRSIEWRDDPATHEAEAWLRETLSAGDPLALTIRLEPGQGILNNNVLHNRTPFENADQAESHGNRLIYRVRFHNRIGDDQWPV